MAAVARDRGANRTLRVSLAVGLGSANVIDKKWLRACQTEYQKESADDNATSPCPLVVLSLIKRQSETRSAHPSAAER